MPEDQDPSGPDVPDDLPEDAPIDLYHRTTPENAARIAATGVMTSLENTREAYFSTRPDGHAAGYGEGLVHIRVPRRLAEIDDEFPDGEQHFRVRCADLLAEHFLT